MAGQIKKLIDDILKKNAKGDKTLESITKTKMILRGINPDKFTVSSADDPVLIAKLKQMAKEMNISI